jgi:hypothetical protein
MAEGIVVLHAHDPAIIHRDMKSLNLLVTKVRKGKMWLSMMMMMMMMLLL